MKKEDAISIFGSVTQLAGAMGISRQAIYMWPEIITGAVQDRVLGAAVRNDVSVPPIIISEIQKSKAT